jgi:hypothetical protein
MLRNSHVDKIGSDTPMTHKVTHSLLGWLFLGNHIFELGVVELESPQIDLQKIGLIWDSPHPYDKDVINNITYSRKVGRRD